MPKEVVGETVHIVTADHPQRTDSPEYIKSRKQLVKNSQGCIICNGPVDTTHNDQDIEDHHGGGIYNSDNELVALNLFPIEWSQGWGTSIKTLSKLITKLNKLLILLNMKPYNISIETKQDVMNYVDSIYNANIPLCKQHHVGHVSQHTPDINNHEAVGIHNIPGPIFWGQLTNDWDNWDMFGGTTGTIAVQPHPDGTGRAVILHVDGLHPDQAVSIGTVLETDHPITQAAIKGLKV